MTQHAVLISIQLVSPVILGQTRSGDENSMRTLAYIPGSVLRGALIHYFKTTKNSLWQAMLTGELRCLNAYPLAAGTNQRTLPLPLGLFSTKDDRQTFESDITGALAVQNWAAAHPETALERREHERFDKHSVFCVADDANDPETITLVSVYSETSAHIARSGARSRVPAKDSSLFSYEALAAEQTFGSVVVSHNASLLRDVHLALSAVTELTIGRSRNAGYGSVTINVSAPVEAWQELSPEEAYEENKLCITLLSDAIVRDSNGVFATHIGSALGVTPLRTFAQTQIVGGFNQTWGLPLPQAIAIKAGSVFVFDAANVSPAVLDQALAEGIGERREDGFGRIAKNWLNHAKLHMSLALPNASTLPPMIASHAGKLAAQKIADALLQSAIANKISKISMELAKSMARPPSNATLARVRLAARSCALGQTPELLTDLLENIKQKPAGDKLQRSRVDGLALDDWIRKRIDANANNLDKIGVDQAACAVGNIKPNVTRKLQVQVGALLIEAVLHHAVKKRQQGEDASYSANSEARA